jgi:hypothetical protein
MTRKILLICGIVSSLLYVATNVFVPMQWEGYSSASQTVSELSAIGAPTRPLWVPLGVAYTLLVAAFGWGVWASARRNRPLRVVGGLMVAYGVIGLGWPPMHLREVLATGGGTLTWSINANVLPAGVLAIPASGSLDAGQSQQVTLNGSTANASFTVDFSSNGGDMNVSVSCG